MNLNVIVDVLTGCTLIILYACHDIYYDSAFALLDQHSYKAQCHF